MRLGIRLAPAAAAGALLLALASDAGAVTDTNFTYSAFKLGSYVISPLEMVPDTAASMAGFVDRIGFSDITNTSNSRICFSTALKLPTGAWIYSLEVFLKDGFTEDTDPLAVFYRYDPVANTNEALVNNSIKYDDDTRHTKTYFITNNNFRLTNTDKYAYGFGFCIPKDGAFFGARIRYHYNSAGE